jgi:hypothetical protein
MRADYLEKFQPVFGEHGFKRLQRQGVTFQNHILPYSNTETGTGHAVSGLLPRSSGIVKNRWYKYVISTVVKLDVSGRNLPG